MKKAVICCLVALFLGAGVFAQESGDSDFNEFESLFEDVEDIEVDSGASTGSASLNGDSATEDGAGTTILNQTIVYSNGNIKFTGSTTAKLGVGFDYVPAGITGQNRKIDPFPAYTMSSSLNFSARIDSTTAVYGSFSAAFPGNLQFSCGSLYFDYLLFDSIYLTAGHKGTSWGNTRIFSGANSFLKNAGGVETANLGYMSSNVINDSSSGVSALFRMPVKNSELSFIGYYPSLSGSPNLGSVSFAACWDSNIGLTNINFFGRSYGYASGQNPVVGSEQKRTVFGYDVYAQELCRLDYKNLNVPMAVITAGFYRLWDKAIPYFGLNIEIQDAWAISAGTHNTTIAVDGGFKRLGKKQNVKLGLSGQHNVPSGSGTVALALIHGGILPYCDLTSGLTADYNAKGTSYPEIVKKVTAATTLSLSLSY